MHLPRTGAVLLAGDAIAHRDLLDPDTRAISSHDLDEAATRASCRKLVDVGASLIVHSHDPGQWASLRRAPEFYD